MPCPLRASRDALVLPLQEFNRQADIAVNLQASLLHMDAGKLHCFQT